MHVSKNLQKQFTLRLQLDAMNPQHRLSEYLHHSLPYGIYGKGLPNIHRALTGNLNLKRERDKQLVNVIDTEPDKTPKDLQKETKNVIYT